MRRDELPRTLAREVRAGPEPVRLLGSLHTLRRLGGVTFLVLRDRSGMVQVVSPDRIDLPRESILEVRGRTREDARAPGGVEVQADEITVLGGPAGRPAFDVGKPVLHASLETQLDHRALSLRHPRVGALFRIVSALGQGFHRHLAGADFVEIHTSKIVGTATEGGANLFRVDYQGRPAYLAQSPQLYKQICVGAFERVFEIGPVYRNEPHLTTRHLNEYTSMDVEVGFLDLDGLLDLETGLLQAMLSEVTDTAGEAVRLLDVKIPQAAQIPRLRLDEAKARLAPGGLSYGTDDDLDPEGERRLGQLFAEEGHDFVFLTHYPVAVRPFYALPDPEAPELTLSFDLLFRGLEVTTGGMRIHDYGMLRESMSRRGIDPEPFAGYLEAFACGMPPHGGFAIGLERLAAQLVGAPNLRATTLFPRDPHRLTP